MGRILRLILTLVAFGWAAAASADVRVTFHSFDGSLFFGRYPHAFVSMEGTLDANGAAVKENYGFSAKHVTPAVLTGPVEHMILVEDEKWLDETNRHFTVTVDDSTYWRLRSEVARWRNAPGKYYDLDKRNCIHFVGALAQIVGLKVSYPEDMLRKPKAWLNHITRLNPQLDAEPID